MILELEELYDSVERNFSKYMKKNWDSFLIDAVSQDEYRLFVRTMIDNNKFVSSSFDDQIDELHEWFLQKMTQCELLKNCGLVHKRLESLWNEHSRQLVEDILEEAGYL